LEPTTEAASTQAPTTEAVYTTEMYVTDKATTTEAATTEAATTKAPTTKAPTTPPGWSSPAPTTEKLPETAADTTVVRTTAAITPPAKTFRETTEMETTQAPVAREITNRPPVWAESSNQCDKNAACSECQHLCKFNEVKGECQCSCLPGFKVGCNPWICEPDAHFTDHSDMSDSACPSGDWIRIGDYCYLGDDRYMSFEKAVDFCEKNDAGLATVPNLHANAALSQHFTNKMANNNAEVFWIGLTQNARTKRWSWSDRSSHGFRKYAADHPIEAPVSVCTLGNWNHKGEWYTVECQKWVAKPACSVRV